MGIRTQELFDDVTVRQPTDDLPPRKKREAISSTREMERFAAELHRLDTELSSGLC